MTKVQMTKEMFDAAQQVISEEHGFDHKEKISCMHALLRDLTQVEFAMALIAPDKIEIIQPESSAKKAM
ncbi:hypothetical protein [Jeotgalibacillus marinus]|uniref:Uncharacterized protein n=1 Tax=Jeotgalibacillus marinus TaxID=86667 RepID=A0ABV3Q784_9BACL